MSISRTSHEHVTERIGESVLQRKVQHQDFEGREGDVFFVHLDHEHTIEITLDHVEKIDSEYVEGCTAFFLVDSDKQFPEGLYKVEPADGGDAMAFLLSPIMAMSQGKLEYQVHIGHLKEDTDASTDNAPKAPDAKEE